MNKKVYIIAEVGINHNGCIETAYHLIDKAWESGADAVKFQTYKAEGIVASSAPKAAYQIETTGITESQLDMLKKLELDENEHRLLVEYCSAKGIEFLSTPFDLESLRLLGTTLNLPKIKIPSGEITNGPLILEAAKLGKPIILSTGMSTLGEIETALGLLAFGYVNSGERPSKWAFKEAYQSKSGQEALRDNVVLLHCTSEYPAPFKDVNLLAMETLQKAFGLQVGLSDHTTGIVVPIAAAARGARVIEKHFTLDKNQPGPDHRASLEPDELKLMVQSVRQVEEALGSFLKVPASSELKNRQIIRKSLVAAQDIKKGELFSKKNLTAKRPGYGVSPMRYWEWLGKPAERNYKKDDVVEK